MLAFPMPRSCGCQRGRPCRLTSLAAWSDRRRAVAPCTPRARNDRWHTKPAALCTGVGVGLGARTIAGTLFGERGRAATRARKVRLEDFLVKNYVVTDAAAYALAIAALLSPLFIKSDSAAPALLLLVAILTVYLGSRAPPILANASLSFSSALVAPLLLALPLLALYSGPKMGIDIITVPYKELVCLFGALVGLENVITNGVAALRPLNVSEPLETSIFSVTVAFVIVFVYLFSSGPCELAASNLIAWSLAVFGIRVITVESFAVAGVFLLGCLCYDAFFVFGTDMMAAVVKQVEAPVVLRMAKSPDASDPTIILGLGDIVIPGVGVAFFRSFGEEVARGAYFSSALAAYAVGMIITLACNTYLQNGQPALLYVVPAVLCSGWLTAAWQGEVPALLSFRRLCFGQDPDPVELGEDVLALKAGTILVARDDDDDATFGAAAILILEHDHSRGSLGVVMNCRVCEPDRNLLLQVLRDNEARWLPEFLVEHSTERSALKLLEAGEVRIGGPAAASQFPFQGSTVLHRDGSLPGARVAVQALAGEKDLFWSYLGEWDSATSDSRGAVLMIGVSSWRAGQLAQEVRRGVWGLARASIRDIVQGEDLRELLVAGGGVQYLELGASQPQT